MQAVYLTGVLESTPGFPLRLPASDYAPADVNIGLATDTAADRRTVLTDYKSRPT